MNLSDKKLEKIENEIRGSVIDALKDGWDIGPGTYISRIEGVKSCCPLGAVLLRIQRRNIRLKEHEAHEPDALEEYLGIDGSARCAFWEGFDSLPTSGSTKTKLHEMGERFRKEFVK